MITNEELNKLSVDELRELNKNVISMIKSKRRFEGVEIGKKLYVGQTIKIDHDSYRGKEFVVCKINHTKAICNPKIDGRESSSFNGRGLSVPFDMIIQ